MGNVLLAISYSQTINSGLMTYMTCNCRICLCTIVVNALVESLRFRNIDQYLVTLGHLVSHVVTMHGLQSSSTPVSMRLSHQNVNAKMANYDQVQDIMVGANEEHLIDDTDLILLQDRHQRKTLYFLIGGVKSSM